MFHTKKSTAGWGITAQTHYSFFENLERGELMRYSYGSGYDHTWNQWYTRYNINMMAIRGSYVAKKPFWGKIYPGISKGDEYLLTTVIPKDLDMPVLVATRAIAAHFSFKEDRRAMLKTDVLDRYRAMANELYCDAGNYRARLGAKIGPHHLAEVEAPSGSDPSNSLDDEHIGDGPSDIINPDDNEEDEDHPTEAEILNPPPTNEFWKDPQHNTLTGERVNNTAV